MMRLTKELREVVKLDLLGFLKGHPAGLDTVELMSMQWLRHPGPAPSLRQFRGVLDELRSEGRVEETVPEAGRWVRWRLRDSRSKKQ